MTATKAGWADVICRQMDPELWFSSRPTETKMAVAHCLACPLRAECLAEAMAAEGVEHEVTRFGIYGGKTPNQRYLIAQGKDDTARCEICDTEFPQVGKRRFCSDACVTESRRRHKAAQHAALIASGCADCGKPTDTKRCVDCTRKNKTQKTRERRARAKEAA